MKSATRWSDVLALACWINLRSKLGWSATALIACWIAWDVVSPRLEQQGQSVAMTIAMFLVVVAAVVTLVLLISFLGLLLMATANLLRKGNIGPRSFTISGEGFTEDDGQRVTSVPWRQVRSIDKTRRHIFVRTGRWKYMLLPARDFQHEYHFAQYYADLVRARHENT